MQGGSFPKRLPSLKLTAHLKMDGWKDDAASFLGLGFGRPIFRLVNWPAVSFREGRAWAPLVGKRRYPVPQFRQFRQFRLPPACAESSLPSVSPFQRKRHPSRHPASSVGWRVKVGERLGEAGQPWKVGGIYYYPWRASIHGNWYILTY